MTNPAALSAFVTGDMENFLVASTPGGIEAQEAAGQRALVASSNMPREMKPSREAFEKMGFVFGDDTDELFVKAELPAGWKKSASDHSMWSYIEDEQGRRRVSIFYKAAFYDRSASARLEPRFSPDTIYPDDQSKPATRGVSDAGKLIYVAGDSPRGYDRAVEDKLTKLVDSWLAERYPNWADPTQYWDVR